MIKYIPLGFMLALMILIMGDKPTEPGVEAWLTLLAILTAFGTFGAWLLIEVCCGGDNDNDQN